MAKYLIRRFHRSIGDVIGHSITCPCKNCENIIPFKEENSNSFDDLFFYYMFTNKNIQRFLEGYDVILNSEDLHELALKGSHLRDNERTGYIAYWTTLVIKRSHLHTKIRAQLKDKYPFIYV